jgi:hypothetical protein
MFTWIPEYLYISLIIIIFFVSPIIVWTLLKKRKKSTNIIKMIFLSLIFFILIATVIFLLKQKHIDIVQDICFEFPTNQYKISDKIPQGCYDFDITKYMGVGWPVSLFFWSILELIYSSFIFFIISKKS